METTILVIIGAIAGAAILVVLAAYVIMAVVAYIVRNIF